MAWTVPIPAAPRVLAANDHAIAVAIEGETGPAPLAVAGLGGLPDGVRGEPGAAVVVLDAAGAVQRTIGVGATRWAMVRALAFDGDELLIGGAFTGTLRVGDRVVTADGNADGFWARVAGARALVWLARARGEGFDSVAGVAALTDGRVAIAWGVDGVPETFVITNDGPIAHKHIGPLTSKGIEASILPLGSWLGGG